VALSLARELSLDALQFHGDEPPYKLEEAVEQITVIKAFRIARLEDLEDAQDYLGQCRPHASLIDSRVAGAFGGTGKTAPWDLLVKLRREFGLSFSAAV